MPASLFHETELSPSPANTTLEDQRALQLALELSMLGLIEDESVNSAGYDAEGRSKKSQNTTECVPVPSSEHVAEIVGRQGCKIKALRAKTNTYIKTPVRGEEPVFVVTGRKEDVQAAKREILSAAEHFSQIRAQRKNNLNGMVGLGPNSNLPGQTTIQVRVPYRVVGLVVGPKGATIKRIQQQTNTYIITPSREKEPIFEVTGLPDSVETARKEIEAHIAIRTGGLIDSTAGTSSSGSSGSSESGGSRDCLNDSPILLMNDGGHPFTSSNSHSTTSSNGTGPVNGHGFTSSLYKAPSDPFSAFISASREGNNGSNDLLASPRTGDSAKFSFSNLSGSGNSSNGNPLKGVKTSFESIYSSFSGGFTGPFPNSIYNTDRDEGIGESPTFDSLGGVATSNNGSSSFWPELAAGLPTSAPRNFPSAGSLLDRRSSGTGSQGSP